MVAKNIYSVGNLLLLMVALHIIALFAAIPSHSSIRGIMISGLYFFGIYAMRNARKSITKWTIHIYSLFAFSFLLLQAPLTLQALLTLDFSDAMNKPELLVYSFKNLSIFDYDANYIGLIIVILAVVARSSFLYWTLSILTGARTVIASALLFTFFNRFVDLNRLSVWLALLILTTLFYTMFNFEEDWRSLYLKQLTVLSLVDNLNNGNIQALFFGDGIESAADQSFVTGHTLLGTVNKNGIFYVLFSLINLRILLLLNRVRTSGPVFIVYFSSILSLTAIYFVLPLIFSVGYSEDD